MTWFSTLTGIENESPQSVVEFLTTRGSRLFSKANSRDYEIGVLTQPTLSDLRGIKIPMDGSVSLSETVADVQDLHMAPENAGAVFQVASQFNLLEMVGPSVTPEDGVGRYDNDQTQGPACAIACGAGTIYRNYFAPVRGGKGQTHDRQIDCLEDVGKALNNDDNGYWAMMNGYALPTPGGLDRLNTVLRSLRPAERDDLLGLLRVGVHADTEVTLHNVGHRVTQVFCSAMPVAYGREDAESWSLIAKLVLDAAYEATLLAAVENSGRTGNNKVFLTMLGGGAFGNRADWIAEALLRAVRLVRHSQLEIYLVSYGRPSAIAQDAISRWNSTET